MEHAAPRLPEFTLKDFSLDVLPIHKHDAYQLILRLNRVSEAEIEPKLQEALQEAQDVTLLVDAITARRRELIKLIRRHEKNATPESSVLAKVYQRQLQDVLLDAVIVSVELSDTKFGRFFPKTRRRLARRIEWIIKPKYRPQNDEEKSRKPPQAPFPPPVSSENSRPADKDFVAHIIDSVSQIAYNGAKLSFSRGSLKDLAAKYRVFYNVK